MAQRKLSSQVKEELSNLINVEFFAGDKIPTEEELCSKFEVSRTTLREAIKELCSVNVLEIRRGVGTFVKKHPGRVDDPFGFKYIDKERFVRDMWETSLLLEPEFASLAALNATEERIEKLELINNEFYEKMIEYKENPTQQLQDELFHLDGEYHKQIAKATGNIIFESLFKSYTMIIDDVITSDNVLVALDDTYKYHAMIIEDIKKKNANDAKYHMFCHDTAVKYLGEHNKVTER